VGAGDDPRSSTVLIEGRSGSTLQERPGGVEDADGMLSLSVGGVPASRLLAVVAAGCFLLPGDPYPGEATARMAVYGALADLQDPHDLGLAVTLAPVGQDRRGERS